MKKIFLLMIGVMLLLSCKQATYYQVYEMRSDDVKTTANNLLYENEDCSVTYNLWARGGRVSFMIYNKTDKNLFVVMPKSFFIMNDVANDYYSESVYGSSVTTMSSASTYGGATISGYMSKANSWYPKTLSRG